MNGFDIEEEKKRYADLAKDLSDSAEQFYQSLRNDMAHDDWARNSYLDSLYGELSEDLDLGSLGTSGYRARLALSRAGSSGSRRIFDSNRQRMDAPRS